MTFVVSTVGLIGYGINKFLKSENLPNVSFSFPVFKILVILITSSFVIFLGSIFTAGGMALLAENDRSATELTTKDTVIDYDLEIEDQHTLDEEVNKGLETEKQENDAAESEVADSSEQDKTSKKKQTNKEAKKLAELKVHFIDVGQADAALVQFQNKAILIDAGNWNKNEVVPYLQQLGIEKIDIIIGSHEHADHIGQIDKVIHNFHVEEVWLPGNGATSQVFERLIDAIDRKGIGYDEPRAGDSYQIGDVKIDIVSPPGLTGNLNNDSIVLKLTYGGIAFLFTGDAEKEAESRIVSSGQNITANILKVGHHGSDTSTTDNFLNRINPEVAIISVGQNNQYGHPNESVLNRLTKKRVELYATESHGTIVVTTDGRTYTVTTAKSGKVTAGKAKMASNKSTPKKSNKNNDTLPKKAANSSSCVDINTASAKELESIIHIGPARAELIIEARPYQTVEDLTRVSGIATKRLADIKAEGIACVK